MLFFEHFSRFSVIFPSLLPSPSPSAFLPTSVSPSPSLSLCLFCHADAISLDLSAFWVNQHWQIPESRAPGSKGGDKIPIRGTSPRVGL